jgi:hypothetical protein
MNLSPEAVTRVVHPTAAFVDLLEPVEGLIFAASGDVDHTLWEDSQLNPKNRIDSLDEVQNPKWRIDGSTGLGTQFYTIPLFFDKLYPIRVDTFIPEQSRHSQTLREILDLDAAFHYKNSSVAKLGISRHILRALEYWTSNYPNFEDKYNELPFGSRIVFENLATDIRDIRISVVPTHYLERQLMSQTSLQELWNLPKSCWPEKIDISQVELCQQLHDSVSLVRVSDPEGLRTMILKALTSSPKYLYHELKTLLTLPPHPNIISRPPQLVTKKCRFGSKTAIIGFTTEYHFAGTLRDIIPERAVHGTLRIMDQLKWASQLTSALIHIQEHGRFYSDLRLDNIVLSEHDDLIMVDFEQRGVWCEFAAPEVNYLDYVCMLASDSELPESVKGKYDCLLERYLPGYKRIQADEYHNSEHGYSIPWLCLAPVEHESAEVYMLGRVLWCIFEGQSSPEVAVWQSYQHEPKLSFPSYHRTPPDLKDLIDVCTKGRKAFANLTEGGVVRKGNRLVLRNGDGTETTEELQAEATRWWKRELEKAEKYLEEREERKRCGEMNDSFGRPKLKEVLHMLQGLRKDIATG